MDDEEVNEEVAESNPANSDEEPPVQRKFDNVTSFIVSEEPSTSTKPRVMTSQEADPVAVVLDDDLPEGEMCASWLEKEAPKLPPPDDRIVDREPSFVHPTEPRCTLKATVSDAGLVAGRWGMSQEAHSDPAMTSKFEYRRKLPRGSGPLSVAGKSLDEVAVALSGSYVGHFYLQVPGKTQPLKCDEKAMSLEFIPNADGDFNIRGFGKNKYGNFEIDGSCSHDLQDLTMFRVYVGKATPRAEVSVPTEPGAPPPRKQSGKDLNRVQAALTSQTSTLKRTASAVSDKAAPPKKPKAAPSIALSASSQRASARPRKAPSHLRGPEQRSAAVANLTEPLRKCHGVVCQLERATGAHWFMTEVDPVALGVLHYRSIIRSPMDFGTVKRRLEDGLVTDVHAFAAEMRLVFRNAMTFNVLPEAPVHEAARDLHDKFEEMMKALWKQLSGDDPAVKKERKKRVPTDDDDDDDISAGSGGGKRPRGAKGAAKKAAKKGPRFVDETPGLMMEGDDTVPMTEFVRLQKQMATMQETIANLQKHAAQTEVTLQTSIEAQSSGKPSAAAKRAAKMKQPLTFQEKAQLSEDINNLPPEKLSHVIKIIQERMPLEPTGDSEVEIDIESMDTETLRNLQTYVKSAKRKSKSAATASKPKPKKQKVLPSSSSVEPAALDDHAASVGLDATTLEDIALGSGFAQDDDDDDLAFALGA